MKRSFVWVVSLLMLCVGARSAEPPLQMSVFAVAGDVQRYLATPEGRDKVAAILNQMHVTGIFLEGRRGDSYVSPEEMKPIRDYFAAQGFRVAGGIATVPGKEFAVRQNTPYGWINYQNEKSQRELANFFRENAGVFDQIIIDDFYCSADTTAESEKARGSRSWGEYRRDLLVSLLEPMVFEPARAARPGERMIIKYPQWYDRFHLFGYDPARMSVPFDRVWVGTEVRNPKTRAMGFVQPTEGYMNFRWIAAVAGDKVYGAWFDHIECTAQNFVDQAWQSVLAGARELTLFHLGDLVEGHPGQELLKRDWAKLAELKEKVRAQPLRGIPFYKPVNSASDDNMWLMDYFGMIGLPVVPAAQYPAKAKAAILGVQAAGDPQLLAKMRRHLASGATLILTPALLRKLGKAGEDLAGAAVSGQTEPGTASEVTVAGQAVMLEVPLEVDLGVAAPQSSVALWANAAGKKVPYLVTHKSGRGRVLVWNTRTFNEADYARTKERLLAPAALGLPEIPQALADELRKRFLAPLGVRLAAPAGVAYYMFGDASCFYNFLDHPAEATLNGTKIPLPANGLVWF